MEINKKMKNPYKFRVGDKFMDKEYAPSYYSPEKRKEFTNYSTKTSFQIAHG